MNIVFLDVDGVLNCEEFYISDIIKTTYIEQHFCRKRIELLNNLCDITKAKVVISSSWRIGRKLNEIKEMFLEVGATFDILDSTPDLRSKYTVRGNEIYKWLIDREESNEEVIENYVIIDDDSDMLFEQKDHFFQTEYYYGLTQEICDKIAIFLNNKNE